MFLLADGVHPALATAGKALLPNGAVGYLLATNCDLIALIHDFA